MMKKDNIDKIKDSSISITGTVDVKKGSVETYLKDEYGIDNVMEYEYDDLRNKNRSDFNVSQVRGNMQLKSGQIRTIKEAEERFDRVANLNFNELLNYRPL